MFGIKIEITGNFKIIVLAFKFVVTAKDVSIWDKFFVFVEDLGIERTWADGLGLDFRRGFFGMGLDFAL